MLLPPFRALPPGRGKPRRRTGARSRPAAAGINKAFIMVDDNAEFTREMRTASPRRSGRR